MAHLGSAHLGLHHRGAGAHRQRDEVFDEVALVVRPGDFYDDTVFKRIVEKHPEFFADLPPLPKTLAECKGQVG